MSTDDKPPFWDIMVIAVFAISAPLWAFSFVTIWSWFVVPLGVRQIGMAHAFGLNLVAKALFYSHLARNKNDGWSEMERDAYNMGAAFLGPIITLAFAWIVHNLM